MLQPGRHGSSGDYRYGFNGKELDDEVKGVGLQYDYGFRIYDPRLGKFLSMDPLFAGYPYYTPYQFAGNKPIWAVDLDGLEELMKTRTRVITTTYIYDQQHDLIDGEFEIFSSTEQRFMTIKSGSEITRKGEVGGAVFHEDKFYTRQSRKKNGKWVYKSIRRTKGTKEFVPPDPNNHNKPIDNGITDPIEPVIKTITDDKVIRNVIDNSVKEPVMKEQPDNEGISSEPKQSISSLENLEKLNFVNFKDEFVLPKPEFFLDPIMKKLSANPKNKAIIYLRTPLHKGAVIENNWFTADYTSDQLLIDREALVRSFLEKEGVTPGQIEIIHKFDAPKNEVQNMNGTITEQN